LPLIFNRIGRDTDAKSDGIKAARTHLSTQAKATFTSIHGALNTKLEAIHEEDTAFMQHISEVAAKLGTPLVGEKIETVIRRDGKRVVEIVEIGKRVEAFKELIEREEEKLKQAWKEWDEVQEEYIELGRSCPFVANQHR
jgi:phosphopantothenoylcysteine decarboxylase